jgi:hypothetical protein
MRTLQTSGPLSGDAQWVDGVILDGVLTTARDAGTIVRNTADGQLYVSNDSAVPSYTQLTGTGGAVAVQDEGVAVADASTLNFVGAGVTATDAGGGVVNVTIPGGATESTALIGTGTAGENLLAGEIVRFDTSGTPGNVLRAQATTLPAADVMGVVKTGVSSGASVTYYERGTVPVLFGAAPPASSNGSRVYLDPSTAGLATLTQPSAAGTAAVLLGWLRGANGVTTNPTVQLRPELLFITPA